MAEKLIFKSSSHAGPVPAAHQNGINVLYANGGARWVDYKLVRKQLNLGVSMFSPAGDWAHDQIWNNLDREIELY